MNATVRYILCICGITLSLTFATYAQDNEALNADSIRGQITRLESMTKDGQSSSVQMIRTRSLLSLYKQFQLALAREVADLKIIQSATPISDREIHQDIVTQLQKVNQEENATALKIQDLKSTLQSTVADARRLEIAPGERLSSLGDPSGAQPTLRDGNGYLMAARGETIADGANNSTHAEYRNLPPVVATVPTSVPGSSSPPSTPVPQSTSLNATLNARISAIAQANIEQRAPSKQAETPSFSRNSTTIVDSASSGDLVNFAANLAGLTGSSNNNNTTNGNSVAFTVSAYSLLAGLNRVDPLNPGFYNRNANWRRLSFTLGYDDEEPVSGTTMTERSRLFGAKYLIIDKREPSRQRHENNLKAVAAALQEATNKFGDLYSKLVAHVFSNKTVREKIVLPQFKVFLTNRQGVTASLAKLNGGTAFILNGDGLPPENNEPKPWTAEELEFYAIFIDDYLGTNYRDKLKAAAGQQVLDDIDKFIETELEDSDAFTNLSDHTQEAIEKIRKAPQLSLYVLSKQRKFGADDYSGEAIFDYGVANRINLVLNGSFDYRDSQIIGGDSRGGRFAGEFKFQLSDDELSGRKPLYFYIGGEGKGRTGEKPTYKVQAKLTLPIANGIDFPLSLSYANRTELITERTIRGQFGFTFDTAKLIKAFTQR